MNRISHLYKMDGLLETCKGCEKNDIRVSNSKKCEGCQVYDQLREIGENLGRKKGMVNKKQCNENVKQPVIAEKKPSETTNTKEDKTAEYKALIKELQGKLSGEKINAEKKDTLIKKLEAKIEKYEHINSACDDVEKEAVTMKKERDSYLNQLLDTRQKLHEKDYMAENQKNRLEHLGKTLELLTKENNHLWGLVSIQAAEKHV